MNFITKKNKNILLIGGTGFIGSYLTKKLADQGCGQISIIHKNAFKEKDKIKDVNYYQIDASKPTKEYCGIINKVTHIVLLSQPNIALIKNLAKLINDSNIPKRIIYISTLLLYNDSPQPQAENADLAPKSDYEVEKLQEEQCLSGFINSKDELLTIVRLANVYGDIKNKGIINHILSSIFLNKPVIINGDGQSVRDYLYIEDAVNMLQYIINYKQKEKIEIFNVCSSKGYSVNFLIKKIESIIKEPINIKFGPELKEKESVIGNNSKFVSQLGISTKYSLEQGLIKTYNNYSLFYSK